MQRETGRSGAGFREDIRGRRFQVHPAVLPGRHSAPHRPAQRRRRALQVRPAAGRSLNAAIARTRNRFLTVEAAHRYCVSHVSSSSLSSPLLLFGSCDVQLLLQGASERGAKRIRVHVLTDGRDVADGSSVRFVEMLEEDLARLREKGVDARIASGGGRMYVTMDRYEVC
jgi:hypothetical protein